MSQPEQTLPLAGRRALVTGASRGVGADTARLLAGLGAKVAVNYRAKKPRADKVVADIAAAGGEAVAISADLTDAEAVRAMLGTVTDAWGGIDVLVLNASGGMEGDRGPDYALRLNRDAQLGILRAAVPTMPAGSRVVFVTSHQAHFIRVAKTMPEYDAVARSKRAGEDALRAELPDLAARGIGFVVVSGDMIEGTITAKLLERINPGAIESRRKAAGRLYNVAEFAAEVVAAVTEPVPPDNIRLVGDTSGFAS
ncbi:MAG TPA: SDR family oxidoreductase [Microbacteriaceae bacterium]|nr:SDR family oxidoreductase [Microbacteriaceae bacterium]